MDGTLSSLLVGYPRYSERDPSIHHTQSACTEGNNIELQYLRSGAPGRECFRCRDIRGSGALSTLASLLGLNGGAR